MIERREFVARLLRACPRACVVSGLGSPSYDVFAAGDAPRHFYLWGAMGGAAAMGLGLALARPLDPVVVITGDGEMLMGIGSLATIAQQRAPNLAIVVLDNGHYGETGMQPSHTAAVTDLAAVARACGLADAITLGALDEADALGERVGACRGTIFARVPIDAGSVPRALPPRDGGYLKNRFRDALGLPPL